MIWFILIGGFLVFVVSLNLLTSFLSTEHIKEVDKIRRDVI